MGGSALPLPALRTVKGYSSLASRIRPVVEHLWVFALVLLIIACARPQLPYGAGEGPVEGLEMVLAIDTSASMKSVEASKSKLARVKQVAKAFIRGRKVDKIGLVAFAGDAVMVCPLTSDYKLLEEFIDELAFGMLPSGTAIGAAVAVSTNLLKEGESESRIIILLSDGVNNSGEIEPLDSASMAKSLGIRIYTIEEGRRFDHLVTRLQDSFGVDVDLLKEIARITRGQHFKIPSPEELLVVYEEIDRLEKQRLRKDRYTYTDIYHWPALLALGLILSESVLTSTRFRRLT